jgi:SsrA-binding protein
LYFKDALLKVEVGVAKGKHTYDKRQSSMEKEIDRNNSREFKYDKYD